jgi:ligand-binding sensor domain-containing protein
MKSAGIRRQCALDLEHQAQAAAEIFAAAKTQDRPVVRFTDGLAARLHAAAATPAPLLADYTHTAWGGLQDAPVDVLKLVQSTNGWLWIATATGLYRYDSVQFERTDTVYGHRLSSSDVLGLMAGADGALWVGYRLGGVTVVRKDGARTFLEDDGLPGGAVFHIEAGPDGTVWAADPGNRYYRVRTDAPAGNALAKPELTGSGMHFDRDGQMWLLQPDTVERRLDARAPSLQAQRLTLATGLSGALPQSFFQDREGNTWIGTSAGLDRFRRNRLRPLPVSEEFDHPDMVPGPDGDVWVGDYFGDVRSVSAAGVGKIALKGHLSASHRAPRGLDPQAIQQDATGALWVSFSGAGLFRRVQGQWVKEGGLTGFPADVVTTMAMDGQGNVWMGHARNHITLVARCCCMRRTRRGSATSPGA